MLTEKLVKSKIEAAARLTAIPMNETLFQLGIDAAQLQKVQEAIRKFWGLPIDVHAKDTVYTITDKLKNYAKK